MNCVLLFVAEGGFVRSTLYVYENTQGGNFIVKGSFDTVYSRLRGSPRGHVDGYEEAVLMSFSSDVSINKLVQYLRGFNIKTTFTFRRFLGIHLNAILNIFTDTLQLSLKKGCKQSISPDDFIAQVTSVLLTRSLNSNQPLLETADCSPTIIRAPL